MIDAPLHRAVNGGDVPPQVVDAVGVVDRAVDDDVIEGHTVLGDREREFGELLVHVHEQLLESVWSDVPAHGGVRALLLHELHGIGTRPRRARGRLVSVAS